MPTDSVLMSVEDTAAAVERHIQTVVWDWLPVSALGGHECLLFVQRMPWDWFWGPKHLLPVVVAVGAARLGVTVPLRPDEDSPFGYVLPDQVPFSTAMVDEALTVAAIEEHHMHNPKRADHGRAGHHLVLTPLVRAFYDVVESQGQERCPALLRVMSALDENFFWSPCQISPD